MIGRFFFENMQDDVDIISTSRRIGASHYLDLADVNNIREFVKSVEHGQFFLAFIVAAVTRFADCDNYPIRCRSVNQYSTIMLIQALHDVNIPTVFLSTSSVFGRGQLNRLEADVPMPDTMYGMTKREVEKKFLNSPLNATIRLTKVLAPGYGILDEWKRCLARGFPVNAFNDVEISPLSGSTVALYLRSWLYDFSPGIFHLTCRESITFFQIAHLYAQLLGYGDEAIKSISHGLHANGSVCPPVKPGLECSNNRSLEVELCNELRTIFEYRL